MAENVKAVEFIPCRKICVVDPGELDVVSGETVVFVNSSKAELRVFFGKNELFGTELIRIIGGGRQALPVKARRPERPVVYHYSVFCDETDTFAVGGSNPRIILNP